METMVRGSRKPDLAITIADASGEADFSVITLADVVFRGEMGDVLLFLDPADSIEVAADGDSAVVTRAWDASDTETVGRMWVSVDVDWGGGRKQSFPHDGPLRIDIVRGPGDA